jgi:hypothetical protein
MKNYRGFLGWGIYQILNSPVGSPKVYRRDKTGCDGSMNNFQPGLTLDAVLNSTSWKVTFPLRMSSKLIKKIIAKLSNFLRF